MNFMYDVISNGIGGVMCGNTVDSTPIYHSEASIASAGKLYTTLVRHVQQSVDLGYLIDVSDSLMKTKEYRLTNKAYKDEKHILRVFKLETKDDNG